MQTRRERRLRERWVHINSRFNEVPGGHRHRQVAFLGYVGLFGPVLGLAGTYKSLRTAQVSVEEVYAILDAQDLLGDAPDAVDVIGIRGEVAWERVQFAFHARRTPGSGRGRTAGGSR
jgi:hypothetical protein